MRGNFHGYRLGACLVHLGQKRFQIERLGGGVMRRNLSPSIAVADRADDSRFHSRRGKYRFDQISDRRFTVGPRYTYQFQLTARPAKKMRRPKPMIRRTSRTLMEAVPGGHACFFATTTAPASRSIACGMKSCPSSFSPGIAKKICPGPTFRESYASPLTS